VSNGGAAWLVIASGDDRQYGGNDGYTDEPDAFYAWDSTVPNGGALAVGDRIALWDKKRLIGYSVIEAIETEPGQKVLRRCAACGKSRIKLRKRLQPRFKCQECGHTFDTPDSSIRNVTLFQSRHDAAWVGAEGVLSGDQLRALCDSPHSQHSIRPLRWDAFEAALSAAGHSSGLPSVDARSSAAHGGHVLTMTRARVGQGKFRKDLLKRHGAVCAVTGPAPEAALDAAHLYSYAAVGSHLEHGGVLLRKDIHRLFDIGSLAVDPQSLEIDLSVELQTFSTYRPLHRAALRITPTAKQRAWIASHWQQHR
jgi:hypothetical protein